VCGTRKGKRPTENGWALNSGGLGRNRTTDTRIFNAKPTIADAHLPTQRLEKQALSALSHAFNRTTAQLFALVSRRDLHKNLHKSDVWSIPELIQASACGACCCTDAWLDAPSRSALAPPLAC